MSTSLLKILQWFPISLESKARAFHYLALDPSWSSPTTATSLTLSKPHYLSMFLEHFPSLGSFGTGRMLGTGLQYASLRCQQTNKPHFLPSICPLTLIFSLMLTLGPYIKCQPAPDILELVTPLVPFYYFIFPKNLLPSHIPECMFILYYLSPLKNTRSRVCMDFAHCQSCGNHSINTFQ